MKFKFIELYVGINRIGFCAQIIYIHTVLYYVGGYTAYNVFSSQCIIQRLHEVIVAKL